MSPPLLPLVGGVRRELVDRPAGLRDLLEHVRGIRPCGPHDDPLRLHGECHLGAGADLEGVSEDLRDDDLPLGADSHTDLEHRGETVLLSLILLSYTEYNCFHDVPQRFGRTLARELSRKGIRTDAVSRGWSGRTWEAAAADRGDEGRSQRSWIPRRRPRGETSNLSRRGRCRPSGVVTSGRTGW